MRETGSGHSEVEIGRLRQQMLALADADCVCPDDGSRLLAALDRALRAAAAGDRSVATPGAAVRAGIERFIAGIQGLLGAGLLAERDSRPPLASARALLDMLRG
jgi:hypothetical protein